MGCSCSSGGLTENHNNNNNNLHSNGDDDDDNEEISDDNNNNNNTSQSTISRVASIGPLQLSTISSSAPTTPLSRGFSTRENSRSRLEYTLRSVDSFSSVAAATAGEEAAAKYNCVKQIGAGKFGVVYLAVHTSTGKMHALKELQETFKPEQLNDVRTIQEIELLYSIREKPHDGLLLVDDVIVNSKNKLCVVTEYVDGTPWGSSLHRCGPVASTPESISVVRLILRDILCALHHLHEELGIAHMDIKPENILVRSNELLESSNSANKVVVMSFIKLIDFGSAVRTAHPTHSTAGTWYFCAPEKFIANKSHPYCAKLADIWSLGVTAALAIFGDVNVPFPKPWVQSNATFRWKILHHPMEDDGTCNGVHIPTTMAGGAPTPPDLFDLLSKMLCRDPKLRPSAAVLLEHPFLVN